jgi:myo-inositol 2-dehydrogenase / D-chiro-inositol 1-dehydrogenase
LIAADHLGALGARGDVEVAAVCDVDASRAERLAPAGARIYERWDELLAREQLDAVWVCTPPLAHRGPTVAALERAVHVYLEKPIARTQEDAEAIVAAAERSEAVCAIGYQWHATEALDDLRRAVEGQQLALLVGRNIGPAFSRPWFLDRSQGGGNILERGSHQIDLLRAIAGEVVRVQAVASGVLLGQGEGVRGDIEDAVVLVLQFESGAVATIVLGWTRQSLPGLYSVDVVATEATLELTLDPEFSLRGMSKGRKVDVRCSRHPFERTIARFIDAARAGDPSQVFCMPADAAQTLAIALACDRALLSRGTVVVGVNSDQNQPTDMTQGPDTVSS